MTTTIHLSGPVDVLAVLPFQLGFHPRDCLVAVSLHGTRMGLVQRIDLPPPEHVGDAVSAMIAPLRQYNPTTVLLIGFEEREGESRAVLDEMSAACRDDGIEVTERMVVRGGRWFAPDCHLTCCPPEGLRLPAPAEVPAVAEFVGREICPLSDRSALAERLEPTSPLLGRAVSGEADQRWAIRRESTGPGQTERKAGDTSRNTGRTRLDVWRASELAVWSMVLRDDDEAEAIQTLRPQDLAVLAVSLTDVALRDGLIAWLCPGTMPRELIDPTLLVLLSRALPDPLSLERNLGDVERIIGLQRIGQRLCELCAALPDVWAVPALTVLASFAWWRGDGALTRIALDRALRVDPHYRLARLLERMVDLAIRPEMASA